MKRRPLVRQRGSRAGLSLVEVLVATMIFGIATSGLAAMTFWVGTRTTQAAGSSRAAAALLLESDRLAALPFDSLDGRSGCADRIEEHFEFARCVRVDELGVDARRVTLIVTPVQRTIHSDSLVFERARATPRNPFQ
jgi:prepilin-type N-terminal cleavage/methylation domain-containing protein